MSKDHFFEIAISPLMICKSDYEVIEMNRAAKTIFAPVMDSGEATCYQMLKGRESACEECPLERAYSEKKVKTLEFHNDNVNEDFEESVHPISTDSGEQQFVIQCRVITEEKIALGQQMRNQRLHSLGQMSAGIAHDLNNVLAIILGRLNLIQDSMDISVIKNNLRVINNAATNAAAVVERIQEFSQSRKEVTLQNIDLNELMKGVIDLTESYWKTGAMEEGRIITVSTDLKALGTFRGDQAALQSALANMIINSCHAMPDGGVLKFRSYNDASYIVLELSDTGIGMTKEVIERVFDPFFTTKGVKGHGLGMSEAYGVIKRHNGDIQIDSMPGKGSTITIRLPYSAVTVSAEEVEEITELPGLSILIVDDEVAILELVKEMLEMHGQSIVTFDDPEDALNNFRTNPYDVVITDLGMPKMSGWELAQAIKSIRPEMPVILLSGWGFSISEAEMRDRGVDAVISKPFTPEILLSNLRDVSTPIRDE